MEKLGRLVTAVDDVINEVGSGVNLPTRPAPNRGLLDSMHSLGTRLNPFLDKRRCQAAGCRLHHTVGPDNHRHNVRQNRRLVTGVDDKRLQAVSCIVFIVFIKQRPRPRSQGAGSGLGRLAGISPLP